MEYGQPFTYFSPAALAEMRNLCASSSVEVPVIIYFSSGKLPDDNIGVEHTLKRRPIDVARVSAAIADLKIDVDPSKWSLQVACVAASSLPADSVNLANGVLVNAQVAETFEAADIRIDYTDHHFVMSYRSFPTDRETI